jgi:cullin-associated NEDD8-dissociated protein 1
MRKGVEFEWEKKEGFYLGQHPRSTGRLTFTTLEAAMEKALQVPDCSGVTGKEGSYELRAARHFHKSGHGETSWLKSIKPGAAWRYFNGNHKNVGFPRDSGPTNYVGAQWNSFQHGHTRQSYRFSVLLPGSEAVESSPEDVQNAQLAVAMSPHFHTHGLVGYNGVRSASEDEGERDTNTKPYKALVIFYLFGGADTFNLLVPIDCDLNREYHGIRKDVALTADKLNPVTTSGQACEQFGIHKQLAIIKELYDAGDAAFVTNVGNLETPVLGVAGLPRRWCPGGFSHHDMQVASQTLVCQYGTMFKHGGGGRMADSLAVGSGSFNVNSFSLSGKAVWSEGETTRRNVLSGNNAEGGNQLGAFMESIIQNFTQIDFTGHFAKEYTSQLHEGTRSFQSVTEALEKGDKLLRVRNQNWGPISALRQVARLIAARGDRVAHRDFFFLGLGGWDMHSGVESGLFFRFGQMETSIRAFVNEMKQQGVWENVVLTTQSDFGRTLDPNSGLGTDHAFAGQHFIIGGAIRGGRVYNKFPESLAAGNPADLGRGRLIPKYPYESYMVPIAKWLGVEDGQLNTVFPNLPNFNASYIIPDLF